MLNKLFYTNKVCVSKCTNIYVIRTYIYFSCRPSSLWALSSLLLPRIILFAFLLGFTLDLWLCPFSECNCVFFLRASMRSVFSCFDISWAVHIIRKWPFLPPVQHQIVLFFGTATSNVYGPIFTLPSSRVLLKLSKDEVPTGRVHLSLSHLFLKLELQKPFILSHR